MRWNHPRRPHTEGQAGIEHAKRARPAPPPNPAQMMSGTGVLATHAYRSPAGIEHAGPPRPCTRHSAGTILPSRQSPQYAGRRPRPPPAEPAHGAACTPPYEPGSSCFTTATRTSTSMPGGTVT